MRKFAYIVIIIIVLLIVMLFAFKKIMKEDTSLTKDTGDPKPTLATEEFLLKHLLHDDDTIRTNLQNKDGSEIALSESIGLWLEYLAEKEDSALFEQAFETIDEQFKLPKNLITWKIEDSEMSNTNALIDDIRIAEALFKEGERTGRDDYIKEAEKISKAVLKHNIQNDFLVDFHDVLHKYTNDELTISYINIRAFQYMENHDVISHDFLQRIVSFAEQLPMQNGFYPKYYNVADEIFKYDETINLIDQLYITMHLERANVNTAEFYEWLKTEFYKENLLYGQYDKLTKENAVEYESVAVYALAILYSVEKLDEAFTLDLFTQMKKKQVNDEESEFFGGYVDLSAESTHSFDNLLALLAERKLLDEELIQ